MATSVHPAAQESLDSFRERVDGHATNIAAWAQHALAHGSEALAAVYRHDREGFQSAFGTLAREVLHAVFCRMAPQFSFGETIETLAADCAAREAAKIYDNIALAAGEAH